MRFHASEQARQLILKYGWNATAYQILNPGIAHWFSLDPPGLVGYVEARQHLLSKTGVWVAAGEPVCAPADVGPIARGFEADGESHGCRVCWFGADSRLREAFRGDPEYSEMVLGAQPIWDPASWPDILAGKASLRAQLHRAENKGVVIEQWSSEASEGHPLLQECLHEWLRSRGLPPLHFLVEPQTLDFLQDRWIFVATKDAKPVGFLVLSPVPSRNGWLVEQIIQGDSAPNGTATLLLDAAMCAAAGNGSDYITLGLSPLSFRAPPSNPNPPWLRLLLGWVRAHGRRFYNFRGLEAFKSKFVPERWDPIVAITREQRPTLGTLHAISDAFSGQRSPEGLISRALWDALLQEAQTARRKPGQSRTPNSRSDT